MTITRRSYIIDFGTIGCLANNRERIPGHICNPINLHNEVRLTFSLDLINRLCNGAYVWIAPVYGTTRHCDCFLNSFYRSQNRYQEIDHTKESWPIILLGSWFQPWPRDQAAASLLPWSQLWPRWTKRFFHSVVMSKLLSVSKYIRKYAYFPSYIY